MSKRTTYFKKLMHQAGTSDPSSFFPSRTVKDKLGQECSLPMKEEKRQRLAAQLDPKKRR